MSNGIGISGMNQGRDVVSIWRICLPSGVDRDKYIQTCYLNNIIFVINENAEIQRAKIGKFAIQLITFPQDKKSFGSEVVCVCAPYSGILYVVDVYPSSSEFQDQIEHQYRFAKTNSGTAELIIDGQGKIILSVDGEDEKSEVTIAITSKTKKGKLNVNVNGDILVQNQGDTTLVTSNNLKAGHKGENSETYINIKEDEIRLATSNEGKIYLNDSDEPILLGNKTAQLMSDILDQLGKESAGPYPLLGNALYLQFKERIEELKSTQSFVK